jgi:hypothetical protein
MKMSNKNCYLLISEGFAEKSVSEAVEFFHTNGIILTLLSLYTNETTNALAATAGSGFSTHLLLGDLPNWELPDGLLVAGGPVCGQHLIIDPRVHRLIRQMQLAANPVGLLYPIFVPFAEAMSHLSGNKPLLFQERRNSNLFLNNFLSQTRLPNSLYRQPTSIFL